jgi:hypothetical protein
MNVKQDSCHLLELQLRRKHLKKNFWQQKKKNVKNANLASTNPYTNTFVNCGLSNEKEASSPLGDVS